MTNQIPNSPTKLHDYLVSAEVDPTRAADTRRMLRNERFALAAALRSGDATKIAAARDEALRVAQMWEAL